MQDDEEIRKKAKALDDMTRDVLTEEADVLERVLLAFMNGNRPKTIDAQKIEAMYTKYLERSEDSGDAASGEENGDYPVDEELDL